MRAAVLAIVLALLAGCTTVRAPVVVPKTVLIEIPQDLMKCPGVKVPDPSTLTDKQVASLILALDAANGECRASMEAIKKFQERVKREIGGSR